ncbi:hypothetical protein BO71DRAFT_480526 [Aspergillus ellipticus CBS 707.79]|uniref:Uncharacterized protein n=1 Tax=Aspergillus ellipticus CBS 707.79 TaxID=1448320 RepID=A0A319E327_9EURO|nr:hypothetical protein BO71DRAFT_480526 [Aspergillus ellipticus CBS 707.79]
MLAILTALCSCSKPSKAIPEPTNQNQRPYTGTHPPPFPISASSSSLSPNAPTYNTPPLPAYTPHPHHLNEKTLEAHLRDPPISSSDHNLDEKLPHAHTESERAEDVTSDASSAISFPSTTHSYGNTSTATRETPPPPYSPWRGAGRAGTESPVPSLSMSVESRSESSGSSDGGGEERAEQGMVQIAAPRAVFLGRGRWAGEDDGSERGDR